MRHHTGVFDPDIVAAVRELRIYAKAMGITNRELARRSKLSEFAIRRWFGESRMPEMDNLKILARALGYDIKLTLELPE